MLDYLSLAKVIRWKFRSIGDLRSALKYPNNDIYSQLTWAFVGRRLDEIDEIEIEVNDQERYLNNVAKLARLRKIWIYRNNGSNHKNMYAFAEVIIKAIQLHHGPDQVSECHMIPAPIILEGESHSYDLSSEVDVSISSARRVLSLLPPSRRYLILPRPDGSTVSLNNSFDPFVATISDMSIMCTKWKIMTKLYPGHSQDQILQRFRGLKTLWIDLETTNGDDENLLTWAACEAEHYHHQPGGHRLGQLVPLENLRISYNGITTPPIGTATPCWKILQDGLFGFSGTLTSLDVNCNGRMVDRLFTVPRPLPKLTSLMSGGMAIDRSVWELAPNIEYLNIDIGFPQSRDDITVPDDSYVDQDTGTPTFSPTSIDTPQQQLTEIWFHCPKLDELSLWGQALCLFDPECLHRSPNLRILEMSCQSQKAPKMIHPTHWTWDWSFPMLDYIRLDSNLHELRFSLAILRSCPTLSELDLGHIDEYHRFPLHVKGIFDALLDRNNSNNNNNNNQMLPFTHSNLRSITFHGSWDIEADELVCLLQVLPGLVKMVIESFHFNEGFGARELVEITKTHPSLMYVSIDMERMTGPPSALGLSEITSDQVTKMSSVVKKSCHHLPNKRLWIVYTFMRFSYYALYL
ncbi:hypothetical protein BGW42_008269 [Actinomortierella wolfii]|nr:hypothetical protein BGW42_008269 [Actinomortierella wolfii]